MHASSPALFVIAGFASTALADFGDKNQIDVKVRRYGSNDAWSDGLTIQSPNLVDSIEVEVATFYYRNAGYSFSTTTHNIVGSPYSAANGDSVSLAAFDNPDSFLHPDCRIGQASTQASGGFNYGSQFQFVYHTGTSGVDANRFRIAAVGNANDASVSGGISIRQRSPGSIGTNVDASDGFMAYRFKLTLACYNGGAQRTVNLDVPHHRIASYFVYLNSSSTVHWSIGGSGGPGNLSGVLPSDPASVTVSWVPAPSSLALLCLGFAGGARRRVRAVADGSFAGHAVGR